MQTFWLMFAKLWLCNNILHDNQNLFSINAIMVEAYQLVNAKSLEYIPMCFLVSFLTFLMNNILSADICRY